jgi:hypothetical protein
MQRRTRFQQGLAYRLAGPATEKYNTVVYPNTVVLPGQSVGARFRLPAVLFGLLLALLTAGQAAGQVGTFQSSFVRGETLPSLPSLERHLMGMTCGPCMYQGRWFSLSAPNPYAFELYRACPALGVKVRLGARATLQVGPYMNYHATGHQLVNQGAFGVRLVLAFHRL